MRCCRSPGWRRRDLETFLAFDAVEPQLAFWRERLDTRRFRAGLDLLLSVTGLRSVYASPFLQVLPQPLRPGDAGPDGAVLRPAPERLEPLRPRAAPRRDAAPPAPPPAHPVDLVCADAASYLESCEPGSYGGFTLSNVLDGAPPEYRQRLLAAVERAARPGAILVLRSFGEPPAPSPTNVAGDDRSMLWGIVEVQPLRLGARGA